MVEGAGDWKVLGLEVAVASRGAWVLWHREELWCVQRGELGAAGALESSGA